MPHKIGLEELISRFHKKDQPLKGIEIGCFKGELTKHLLNTFPNLYLTTIDPYLQWSEVLENTKHWQHRLQILPFPSDVAVNFLDNDFDFVFIDGDHSYEQCRKDIVNYIKVIKPGGLISGHNYHKTACVENGFTEANNTAHPGVHKSVDEIFQDRVKLAPDFTWYVQI